MSSESEQIALTIKTITEDLLNRLGIVSQIDCKTNSDGPYLLKIDPKNSEDTSLLIGWHGESILALQYVLRLTLKKKFEDHIPFVLDVGDYRDKQEKALKKIGEEAASKAIATNKPVILNPMTAFERRVVHMVITEKESVKSESVGEGDSRRVMVRPE